MNKKELSLNDLSGIAIELDILNEYGNGTDKECLISKGIVAGNQDGGNWEQYETSSNEEVRAKIASLLRNLDNALIEWKLANDIS